MNDFPKTCIMIEGSVYLVTFEDVKRDWEECVRQFDDMSDEEKQLSLDNYTEDEAETWWQEQCFGANIPRIGMFLHVDEQVRHEFLKNSLTQGGWERGASEYEVDLE